MRDAEEVSVLYLSIQSRYAPQLSELESFHLHFDLERCSKSDVALTLEQLKLKSFWSGLSRSANAL